MMSAAYVPGTFHESPEPREPYVTYAPGKIQLKTRSEGWLST